MDSFDDDDIAYLSAHQNVDILQLLETMHKDYDMNYVRVYETHCHTHSPYLLYYFQFFKTMLKNSDRNIFHVVVLKQHKNDNISYDILKSNNFIKLVEYCRTYDGN
jgi:chaperonin GroEL (HSP60 family)